MAPAALLRIFDISKWQGQVVNWRVFSDAAGAGVYLKACEGLVRDPDFHLNLACCRNAAMLPGAYLFLRPEVDAKKQAALLYDLAPKMPTDLAPAIDIEFSKRDGADEWLALTTPQAREAFILETAQALSSLFGRPPVLYTSASFVSQYLPANHKLGAFPLWVAAYPLAEPQAANYLPTFKSTYLPAGWNDWAMWQFGQVKLPGIGVVDASLMKS